MNHHLRLALDLVSDGVFILQDGVGETEGPIIAWANAAALRMAGRPSEKVLGASLRTLLTLNSWQKLQSALRIAFQGQTVDCELNWTSSHGPAVLEIRASVQAALGPAGEILSVILTCAAPGNGCPQAPPPTGPPGSWPTADPAVSPASPPPSPESWQGDVMETIRETARQVAHEFNNALTSIVLPVEMAIGAIPHSGELFESLQVAHVSAQRATDLARDFLDCFRPRPAVRTVCAPADLLGRAMRLATCGQQIGAQLLPGAGLWEIDVDESQLERVIFNLIRNACQAMPNGGRLHVSAANRIVAAGDGVNLPAGNYISIAVRDFGPGIPEEHRRHLFHSRFTTKTAGNGCGLPICYQIVRAHGGEILVRSRVHVGTEFTILLPAARKHESTSGKSSAPLPELNLPRAASAPHPPAAAASPHSRNGHGNPRSLLVVDDEPGVRSALEQMARKRKFEVTTAATSDAALQFYKDRLHAGSPFDTVLLDLNLRSGLHGREVFQAIRRMDPEACVVATSGQHAPGDAERFRADGWAGFLPKPYSMEAFDRIVGEAVSP